MSVAVDLLDLTKVYASGTAATVDRLNLTIAPGELVALLGPSGSGKTTTLKMLAGLIQPTEGDIRFDGRSVVDIAPERRRVAMVFQKPLLFPHMSVGENVAFGLRMQGLDARASRRRVAEILDLVHLLGLEARRPGQLSGGQEQRVSLARSLVTEPEVLLLDEPLSQLDANLRVEMRDLIRQIQERLALTTIFVTHDQEEAVMLADRIALMFEGRLQQEAVPQMLYERPASLRIARFFGTQNFVPGEVRDGTFESPLGPLRLEQRHADGPGILTIRQEAIEVGAGPNSVEANVERSIYLGTHVRVWARAGGIELQFTAAPGQRYERDESVALRLPADHLWIVPPEEATA